MTKQFCTKQLNLFTSIDFAYILYSFCFADREANQL